MFVLVFIAIITHPSGCAGVCWCVCVCAGVPVSALHVLDTLNCFCMRRFTAVFKLLLLWLLRLQATCTALKLQLSLLLPSLHPLLSLSLLFLLAYLLFSLSLLGAASVGSVASEMHSVALGKGSLSRI